MEEISLEKNKITTIAVYEQDKKRYISLFLKYQQKENKKTSQAKFFRSTLDILEGVIK